ncbi:MAG: hypothetical protein RIG77_05630 [Cyclobacteriaceae bacterium]
MKRLQKPTFLSIFCMAMALSLVSCNRTGSNRQKPIEDQYLDSLEVLFSGLPAWLATVYDPASGGFYHNSKMVNDPQYGPDMQSTFFGLKILLSGNIVNKDSISESFRAGLERYVKTRYDPNHGLFLDPRYAERTMKSERTLGRVQNMANDILNRIGFNEVVDTPLDKNKTPNYLTSTGEFRKWVAKLRWERVWSAFDRISSQSALIKRLPKDRADSLVSYVRKYAESIQNNDGLWGEGQSLEVRISGAVKYGAFCERWNIPMPNPDKIYKALLYWFKTNKDLDFTAHSVCPICVPRNALQLLSYIKPQMNVVIGQEDRMLILVKTIEMLRFYSNSDGGFMKSHLESTITPNDINHGKYDELISDSNGAQLAIVTRQSLYEMLGLPVPRLAMDPNELKFF